MTLTKDFDWSTHYMKPTKSLYRVNRWLASVFMSYYYKNKRRWSLQHITFKCSCEMNKKYTRTDRILIARHILMILANSLDWWVGWSSSFLKKERVLVNAPLFDSSLISAVYLSIKDSTIHHMYHKWMSGLRTVRWDVANKPRHDHVSRLTMMTAYTQVT